MLEPLSGYVLSEPLTWEQICERYPDQWVVLVEIDRPDEDHSTSFQTARVAGVGQSRRESFEQARPFERGYPGCANRFTGPIARLMPRDSTEPVPFVRLRPRIPKPAFFAKRIESVWPSDALDEAKTLEVETILSEPLTWDQIRERYPEQWLVLVEMEWANNGRLEFKTARVAGHGKTRDEPLEQARPLRSRYSCFCNLHTGTSNGALPWLLT